MTLAVSVRAATARIALLRGDELTDYAVWHFDQPDSVGDVYTGRITSFVPAMAGYFVELGDATGFLPASAAPPGLTEGAYLTVTISRAAQGGKGPRLGAAGEPAGDRPGLLRRGPGPLLELAARHPGGRIVINDYGLIAQLRPVLEDRMAYQTVTFDPVLEDEIAALHQPSAALPGGTTMHVTPTPALTAIDIDAGAASAAGAAKPAAQLALNTALLPVIARQIRLRNLSGAILIDFAGMKSAARARLADPLRAALATDPLKPRFLGFSNLGLAEITRPRIRPALHEITP
jgi:Ribonuclease G/E